MIEEEVKNMVAVTPRTATEILSIVDLGEVDFIKIGSAF
jgi:hypothetical protein